MGKFLWQFGRKIFRGDKVGMGNFLKERDGDGENLMGMGCECGKFNLPCHSLVHFIYKPH